MPDLTSLVGGTPTRATPSAPTLTARGVVSKAPNNVHSSLFVVIPTFSPDYEFEVEIWAPQGVTLPQKGAACLVIFDEQGDAYVPVWNGRTDLVTDFGRAAAWEWKSQKAASL